jgi:hypothetical protein
MGPKISPTPFNSCLICLPSLPSYRNYPAWCALKQCRSLGGDACSSLLTFGNIASSYNCTCRQTRIPRCPTLVPSISYGWQGLNELTVILLSTCNSASRQILVRRACLVHNWPNLLMETCLPMHRWFCSEDVRVVCNYRDYNFKSCAYYGHQVLPTAATELRCVTFAPPG